MGRTRLTETRSATRPTADLCEYGDRRTGMYTYIPPQVNKVIVQLQTLYTNVISDPGGSLVLSNAETRNAVIAAGLYISFLQDPQSMSEQDAATVIRTVQLVQRWQASDSNSYIQTPSAKLLRDLMSNITTLVQRGYGLPPLRASPPPPAFFRSPPQSMERSPPPPPPRKAQCCLGGRM